MTGGQSMSETQCHLLEVQALSKKRTQGRWWQRQFEVRALDSVDLTLDVGCTLALVGQSGAGKTTLAMCLVGLEHPDEGVILFNGKSVLESGEKKRMRTTQDIQLIFQDSAGALSPRMSAVQVVEEPLLIRGEGTREERHERAIRAMQQVGLSPAWKNRRPHELSGGQRQRLAIARALITAPRLLILDEALAGLDLSIQGQIVNLLMELQIEQHLSYLYITHNHELASRIANEVVILHEGRVVERFSPVAGVAESLFDEQASGRSEEGDLRLGAHSGA